MAIAVNAGPPLTYRRATPARPQANGHCGALTIDRAGTKTAATAAAGRNIDGARFTHRRPPRERGFTLVEGDDGLAIMAILTGLSSASFVTS